MPFFKAAAGVLRSVFSVARYWAMPLYAIGIFFLFTRMPRGSERLQFLAQATLQTNHRIVEGDIAEAGWPHRFFTPTLTTREDFVGRYVERCVLEDNPLEFEATLSGPKLKTPDKVSIVWISLIDLPPADVATLDVQGKLDVCNIEGDQQCATYQVQAIACSGKDLGAATCSAGIQITDDQRAHLFGALDKNDAAAGSTPVPQPSGAPRPQPTEGAGDHKHGIHGTVGIRSPIHLMIHHETEGNNAVPSSEPSVQPCLTPAPTPRSPAA